jgi:hypothetical protein
MYVVNCADAASGVSARIAARVKDFTATSGIRVIPPDGQNPCRFAGGSPGRYCPAIRRYCAAAFFAGIGHAFTISSPMRPISTSDS